MEKVILYGIVRDRRLPQALRGFPIIPAPQREPYKRMGTPILHPFSFNDGFEPASHGLDRVGYVVSSMVRWQRPRGHDCWLTNRGGEEWL